MSKKTIAQQLGITNFPFEIKDNQGRVIYHEKASGHWVKNQFDSGGKLIFWENSYGDKFGAKKI